MKKVYLLFVAIILAACSAEPVENEMLTGLDANLEGKNGKKAAVQVVEDPMGFYSGNSGNLKGTLEIWNDCDNLYVEITPINEYPEEVSIWLLNDLAELNGGKNQVKNVAIITESDPQDLLWVFPVADLDLNEDLLIYVKAYGDYAGELPQEKVSYTDYDFVFENCGCEESFDYIDNEDGTYTFTYLPEEDVDGAELVFTFPQAEHIDGLSGWTHNGKENSQTFKTTLDLKACTTNTWTVTLDGECQPSGKTNLWTDFKVGEVSKKEQFELENIVKSCD